MRGPLVHVDAEERGDDNVADAHTDRAGYHHGFAAEAVDVEYGGDSGEEHCYADYTGGEERSGVAAGAKGGEDGRGVIQHCVYTCLEEGWLAN